MAVILKNSAILHIPKTAGKYVRSVLDVNGIQYYQTPNQPCVGIQNLINRGHSSHCLPLDDEAYLKTINRRACFLRHPLTWYQSYWAYRVWQGQLGRNPFLYWRLGTGDDGYAGCILDEATHADDFQPWIDNVIEFCERTPELQGMGVCTLGFDVYIGQCSYVGKMENLNADLEKFLWMYEGEVVSQWPERVNEGSKEFKARAKYRPGQPERLMQLEAPLVDRFGYNYYPDGLYEDV